MAGIVRYGSYVPFFRLERKAFGGGRGERAIASFDEDSVSMAVEAARDAVRDAAAPDTVLFASTTHPYLEKLNAATVSAALDLPAETLALDLAGSTRSGVSSLLTAASMADGGRRVLAASGEVVVGAPSGSRESAGGDGACAFVFGPDKEALARVVAVASVTEQVLDVWRSDGMPFAKQWEERFGADVFVPLIGGLIEEVLREAGVKPEELSRVVLDGTNARAVRTVLGMSKLDPDKIADAHSGTIGRTGSAHVGLMLAGALDEANPGEKILVLGAADGADAVVLEVTDRIASQRPRHSVDDWVKAKRNDIAYTTYLKWRGVLAFEPPRRPDPERPAAPPMARSERWKYAFVGSRCTACGAAQLPPQRVCVQCQKVDEMEPAPFADAACRIATYTLDRLAYSLQPPVVAAVLDFEDSGRYICQLTDVDPEKVAIGDELEMTFRLFHTADGVHNYFWKARPQRKG